MRAVPRGLVARICSIASHISTAPIKNIAKPNTMLTAVSAVKDAELVDWPLGWLELKGAMGDSASDRLRRMMNEVGFRIVGSIATKQEEVAVVNA